MRRVVGVLDYGMGNIASVKAGLARAGAEKVVVVRSSKQISACDSLVVPGVGSFAAAMRQISPLKSSIERFVEQRKPLLGICLGMQLLFEDGNEGGNSKGLGLLRGRVELLAGAPKLPHVGWNQVKQSRKSCLFKSVANEAFFYFVHSYACFPKEESTAISKTDYGTTFVSAVEKQNVFGVQFHPEKSGEQGKRVLQNFLEVAREWK